MAVTMPEWKICDPQDVARLDDGAVLMAMDSLAKSAEIVRLTKVERFDDLIPIQLPRFSWLRRAWPLWSWPWRGEFGLPYLPSWWPERTVMIPRVEFTVERGDSS